TLVFGFVPIWLLLVRRPEDLGLSPDGLRPDTTEPRDGPAAVSSALAGPEFSRRQGLAAPPVWLPLLCTVTIYPVPGGVSLHQAPYLIERGIDPTTAALIVSTFSALSAVATLACGALPRGVPVRFWLAATGAVLALGVALMLGVRSAG